MPSTDLKIINTPEISKIKAYLEEYHPYKIILFGSYTNDTNNEDSDIDLIFIENKAGIYGNFHERIKAKSGITKNLRKIADRPIDLLLYTKDEWQKLLKINNSFIREITNTGIELT